MEKYVTYQDYFFNDETCSSKISLLLYSGCSKTNSNKVVSVFPIFSPGSIPSSIKSFPVTARVFKDTHSCFFTISLYICSHLFYTTKNDISRRRPHILYTFKIAHKELNHPFFFTQMSNLPPCLVMPSTY